MRGRFRWIFIAAGALLAGCATPVDPDILPPGFQEIGVELFDRDTLRGWENRSNGPWRIIDESIEVATTRGTERLWLAHPLSGLPLTLQASITPLGRGSSDGKMVKLIDANGLTASVSLDDDVPDTLAIYADSADGTRRRRVGGLDVVVATGEWVTFRCRIDGKTLRVTQGGRVVEAPYACVEPIRILLETQRTGARFRDLVLY